MSTNSSSSEPQAEVKLLSAGEQVTFTTTVWVSTSCVWFFFCFYPPRVSCVSASCFILVAALVLPVFIAGRFPAASSPVWLQLMYVSCQHTGGQSEDVPVRCSQLMETLHQTETRHEAPNQSFVLFSELKPST